MRIPMMIWEFDVYFLLVPPGVWLECIHLYETKPFLESLAYWTLCLWKAENLIQKLGDSSVVVFLGWPTRIPNLVWVQSLSRVWLFVTTWTTASQASLSLTIFWSLPKFMSIALVMPSSHHRLWRPLFLSLIFPSIKVFFQCNDCLYQVTKILEFQLHHQSFQWLFRVDFL